MPNFKRVFKENSIVFLTVVTYKRKNYLINNYKILHQAFNFAKEKYPYSMLGYVIMQEHFHILIKPKNIKDYPNIIKSIKIYFTKTVGRVKTRQIEVSRGMRNKGESGIWQSKYYEHTIRDIKDFYTKLEYIHYNPVKHKIVKNVFEYPYSSFLQYVKIGFYDIEWGCFEDVGYLDRFDFE